MKLRLPKTRGMLRREAAGWLARLEGGSSPEAEQKFQRWYEADPAHAEAFERVRRSYASAGLLRHSETAREHSLPVEAPRRSPQPRWALAGAAGLALLVPGALLIADGGFPPIGRRNTVLLASSVGEIRRVALEDGSRVTLDTSTAVEVELGRSERRAVVREGRARFEVAPDPRPFIIEAGAAKVESDSAVLDVETAGEQSRVEVYSGSATVTPAATGQGTSTVTVEAGEGFSSVGDPDAYRLTSDRSAWTKGMLQFDGTPLAEAVAAANRYSARKLIVADGAAQLRVTGAFRAGDISGLARSLAQAFDLELGRTRDGHFLLSPQRDSISRKKNGG